MTQEETRNLPKTAQASKVVNPFTRALTPPFIGRRRDFYIPKVPSNPRNIPNVNTYMNVFYISYIYKLATSSHAKPRLFEATSLTWRLLVHESPHSGYLHTPRLPNSNFSGFPNSADSRFHGFADSWLRVFIGSRPQELCRSKASHLHRFATPELRRFKTPDLRKFVTSDLRRFKIPNLRKFVTSELRRFKIPDLRKFATSELRRFKIPENSFHEFHNTRRFEGDKFSWIPNNVHQFHQAIFYELQRMLQSPLPWWTQHHQSFQFNVLLMLYWI
jgi:hypothetical protein